jgi:hypothetical protein
VVSWAVVSWWVVSRVEVSEVAEGYWWVVLL